MLGEIFKSVLTVVIYHGTIAGMRVQFAELWFFSSIYNWICTDILFLIWQRQMFHHPTESVQRRPERSASHSGTTRPGKVEAGVEERRGLNWTSNKTATSASVYRAEIILIQFFTFVFVAVYTSRVWWMSCWCKPLTRLTMRIWSLVKFPAAAVFTKIQLPLLQMN